MAWLHATPKPAEGTRRAKAENAPPALSRLDQIKRDKLTPQMPPLPAPHFIDRLIEIGLTEAAGMGAGPLSWATIAGWQQVTGIALEPWEARLYRKLSLEYLAEGRRAESENCPPPWRATITQAERDVEQRRLEQLLG